MRAALVEDSVTRVWGIHLVVGVVAALLCSPAHAESGSWRGKETLFRKLASGQHRGRSLAQLRARGAQAIAELLKARPGRQVDAKAFARLMGAIPPAVRAELLAEHGVSLVKRPRSYYGRVGYRVSHAGKDGPLGMLWRQVMAPNTVRTTDGHLVWISDNELAVLAQTPVMRGRGRWHLPWNSVQLVAWLHAYAMSAEQRNVATHPINQRIGPLGIPVFPGESVGPQPRQAERIGPLRIPAIPQEALGPNSPIGPLQIPVVAGQPVALDTRPLFSWSKAIGGPEHSTLWKRLTPGGVLSLEALFTLDQAARFGVMTDLADPIHGP
jgi:hypothetical protein